MCRPFNQHDELRSEFHGLFLYVFAVLSIYFLICSYKPPQIPKKSSKKAPTSLQTTSNVKEEYLKSHKFRVEQRSKYERHKTFKRRQNGAQGSLEVSRQFTFRGFNVSPVNTPTLSRNTTLNSASSSMIESVKSITCSNEQSLDQVQLRNQSSREESNVFTFLNRSSPSNLNTGHLSWQEEAPRLHSDNKFSLSKNQDEESCQEVYISRQSSFNEYHFSQSSSSKLSRNNAFDASQSTSMSSVGEAENNLDSFNRYKRKYKSNFDRKCSLRRKALSVEMIRNSSEECNPITLDS